MLARRAATGRSRRLAQPRASTALAAACPTQRGARAVSPWAATCCCWGHFEHVARVAGTMGPGTGLAGQGNGRVAVHRKCSALHSRLRQAAKPLSFNARPMQSAPAARVAARTTRAEPALRAPWATDRCCPASRARRALPTPSPLRLAWQRAPCAPLSRGPPTPTAPLAVSMDGVARGDPLVGSGCRPHVCSNGHVDLARANADPLRC
jgi:hypothetical protein